VSDAGADSYHCENFEIVNHFIFHLPSVIFHLSLPEQRFWLGWRMKNPIWQMENEVCFVTR